MKSLILGNGSLLISFRCASGVCFEEVGEGALVAEGQREGNFSNGHVSRAQQVAGFLKGKVVEIVVDGVTREFTHHPAEIGRRDVEFVGIEAYLSMLAEVLSCQEKEYLQYVLLVSEVGRYEAAVVGQFADEEQTDVHQRSQHLYFIDMYVADGASDLLEDAAELCHLCCIEMIDAWSFVALGRHWCIPAIELHELLVEAILQQQTLCLCVIGK